MAKKKKEQKDLESTWMLSYSDLMTIVFALFVVLFALSEIDADLWERFVQAASFNPTVVAPLDFGGGDGINDLMGNGIVTLPDFITHAFERPTEISQNRDVMMAEMVETLRTYFAEYHGLAEGVVEVEITGEGQLTITTHGDMYFDTGQAVIRPETFPILEIIGMAIAALPDIAVEVIGHTDNQPIRSVQFPSNWELSLARANNVAQHLIYNLGAIEPHLVSISGHGEYRPVDTNLTPEGRQRNRRVEIILSQIQP